MNSKVNNPEKASLLSEVPAQELNAVGGGLNTMLWDESTKTGVYFSKTGQIYWSTGNGRVNTTP